MWVFRRLFFIKLRLTLDIRLDPEDISKSIINITKSYTCMNYLGTINVNIDIKLFKSYMYHDGLKNLDEFDDIGQIVWNSNFTTISVSCNIMQCPWPHVHVCVNHFFSRTAFRYQNMNGCHKNCLGHDFTPSLFTKSK